MLAPAYIAVALGAAFGGLTLSWLGAPERIVRLLPPPQLFLYFAPCVVFYIVAEIVSPVTTVRYIGDPAAISRMYGGDVAEPHGVLALPAHLFDIIRDWLPVRSGMGGTRTHFWRHQEPAEFLLSLGFLFFVISARRKSDAARFRCLHETS